MPSSQQAVSRAHVYNTLHSWKTFVVHSMCTARLLHTAALTACFVAQ